MPPSKETLDNIMSSPVLAQVIEQNKEAKQLSPDLKAMAQSIANLQTRSCGNATQGEASPR